MQLTLVAKLLGEVKEIVLYWDSEEESFSVRFLYNPLVDIDWYSCFTIN